MSISTREREMAFGMADIKPGYSGTPFIMHVYKDVDRRARHGPRVKVYPGKPSARGDIVVGIGWEGDPWVEAGNEDNFTGRELKQIFRFVKRNRFAILRYWSDDTYFFDDFLVDLVPNP